jgi:hypothetical protein
MPLITMPARDRRTDTPSWPRQARAAWGARPSKNCSTRPRVRRQLVVAIRHNDHHARVLHPAGQQTKHIQRRRIRPMRILDHCHHQFAPPQRTQHQTRKRKPIIPLGCVSACRPCREQLAHWPERNRNRQRLTRPHNEHRTPLQPRPQPPQQRRLADPRLASNEHERSLPRARRINHRDERLKLQLTLEQRLHSEAIVIRAPDSGPRDGQRGTQLVLRPRGSADADEHRRSRSRRTHHLSR